MIKRHSFSETKQFDPIILDYIKGDSSINTLTDSAQNMETLFKRVEQKADYKHRALLARVLNNQYDKYELEGGHKNKVKKHIRKLLSNKTFTVTTGHQLCLLGGPLYTIYKIASTIKLSTELKAKYPNYDFLPLFWLASEDHDFEEISTIELFNKRLSVESPNTNEPCGRMASDIFSNAVEQCKTMLGPTNFSGELAEIIDKAYLSGHTISVATAVFWANIFKDTDLLILDGDEKELKETFSPIVGKDILQQNSFRLIEAQSKKINLNGYKTKLNPREINLFYFNKNKRLRLIEEKGIYRLVDTDIIFSKQELKDKIRHEPENFSPNVVMRPLYQEHILPNIAYIGGANELQYWFQLKEVFAHYHIPYPALILRDSFLLADKRNYELWKKLGFEWRGIFEDVHRLEEKYVYKNSTIDFGVQAEKEQIGNIMKKLSVKIEEIDPTLSPKIKALEAKIMNGLDEVEHKTVKKLKNDFENNLTRIRKIKDKMFPDGVLQERRDNFIPYYLKEGPEFIHSIIKNSSPLEPCFKTKIVV